MPRVEGVVKWLSPIEASVEESGEVPECYTPLEWRLFYGAAKGAMPPTSGKKKRVLPHDTAMRLACGDCQVFYQKEQLLLGNCHPPSLDITPLFRTDDE
jgi:hypothetical protein